MGHKFDLENTLDRHSFNSLRVLFTSTLRTVKSYTCIFYYLKENKQRNKTRSHSER